MLLIFSILRIVDLAGIIAIINKIRVKILTIAITTIIIAVSHREKNILFVIKKVVAQISIQLVGIRKQKNFRDKIENSIEIKANSRHF